MSDSLVELLLSDPAKRKPLIDDCVQFIDTEVRGRSGLSGVALKGAYKIVQKIRPGIVRDAMDGLLNEFVERLDPLFGEHIQGGGDPTGFESFLTGRADEAADLLLGVTDERAQRTDNKTLKSAYGKLRGQAKKYVVEAVPGAGKIFSRHV